MRLSTALSIVMFLFVSHSSFASDDCEEKSTLTKNCCDSAGASLCMTAEQRETQHKFDQLANKEKSKKREKYAKSLNSIFHENCEKAVQTCLSACSNDQEKVDACNKYAQNIGHFKRQTASVGTSSDEEKLNEIQKAIEEGP